MVIDDYNGRLNEKYQGQEKTIIDEPDPIEIPSGLENKLDKEDRNLSEVFEDIVEKASKTLGRKKELESSTYNSKENKDYFEPFEF